MTVLTKWDFAFAEEGTRFVCIVYWCQDGSQPRPAIFVPKKNTT